MEELKKLYEKREELALALLSCMEEIEALRQTKVPQDLAQAREFEWEWEQMFSRFQAICDKIKEANGEPPSLLSPIEKAS